MCGIFGTIGPNTSLTKILEMLNNIQYRGQDQFGISTNSQVQHVDSISKFNSKSKDLEKDLLLFEMNQMI